MIVPQLTGEIRFEPSIPSDLRMGASLDDQVRLFHERSGVALNDRSIQVNITAPGRYTNNQFFETQTLSNVTVDSYLVHFNIDNPENLIAHSAVTIRFDRPIVGVITSNRQLAATDLDFGVPGVIFADQPDPAVYQRPTYSGLDLTNDAADETQLDTVFISEDRRTLTLDLVVSVAIDQLRVLVESDKPN